MEDKKPRLVQRPVFRIMMLLFLVVVVFAVVQQMAVPSSFGAYGYYRGDNVDEWAELAVQHVETPEQCATCHTDKVDAWKVAEHAGVTCESCHGPAKQHTGNPVEVKPARDNSREFCGTCHQELQGRSAEVIRQVDLAKHNTGMECAACHDPHAPWAKLGGGPRQ